MSQENEIEILRALEHAATVIRQMVFLIYTLVALGFVLGGWNMAIQMNLTTHARDIESLKSLDARKGDSIARIDRNIAIVGARLGVAVETPR